MLAPRIFNDNFDLFRLSQNPWFGWDDHEFRNIEKKLYGHRAKNVMNTDIKESDSGYDMMVDLPGFKKEDISVALENGYLTISASKGYEENEAENEDAQKAGNYIRRERYTGSCSRSFYVGEVLNVDDIKASFKEGILNLSIPKKNHRDIECNKYVAIEG